MKRILLGNILITLFAVGCGLGSATKVLAIGKNQHLSHTWLSNRVKSILGMQRADNQKIVAALLRSRIAIVPRQVEAPVRFTPQGAGNEGAPLYDAGIVHNCLAHDCTGSGHILMVKDGKLNHRSFRIERGLNTTTNEQWLQVVVSTETVYDPNIEIQIAEVRERLRNFNNELYSFSEEELQDYNKSGVSSTEILMRMMKLMELKTLVELSRLVNYGDSVISSIMNGKSFVSKTMISKLRTAIDDIPTQATKAELIELLGKLRPATAIERRIAKVENLYGYEALTDNEKLALQIKRKAVENYRARRKQK